MVSSPTFASSPVDRARVYIHPVQRILLSRGAMNYTPIDDDSPPLCGCPSSLDNNIPVNPFDNIRFHECLDTRPFVICNRYNLYKTINKKRTAALRATPNTVYQLVLVYGLFVMMLYMLYNILFLLLLCWGVDTGGMVKEALGVPSFTAVLSESMHRGVHFHSGYLFSAVAVYITWHVHRCGMPCLQIFQRSTSLIYTADSHATSSSTAVVPDVIPKDPLVPSTTTSEPVSPPSSPAATQPPPFTPFVFTDFAFIVLRLLALFYCSDSLSGTATLSLRTVLLFVFLPVAISALTFVVNFGLLGPRKVLLGIRVCWAHWTGWYTLDVSALRAIAALAIDLPNQMGVDGFLFIARHICNVNPGVGVYVVQGSHVSCLQDGVPGVVIEYSKRETMVHSIRDGTCTTYDFSNRYTVSRASRVIDRVMASLQRSAAVSVTRFVTASTPSHTRSTSGILALETLRLLLSSSAQSSAASVWDDISEPPGGHAATAAAKSPPAAPL